MRVLELYVDHYCCYQHGQARQLQSRYTRLESNGR
jgi:hypothetical protein